MSEPLLTLAQLHLYTLSSFFSSFLSRGSLSGHAHPTDILFSLSCGSGAGGIVPETEQQELLTCSNHPNHSHREVGFVVTAKKRVMILGLGSYFYIGRAAPRAVLHLFHRPGSQQYGHIPHLSELLADPHFEHIEITLSNVNLKRIYNVTSALQIVVEQHETHTFVMVCDQDIEYCPEQKLVSNDDISIAPSGVRESLWGGLVSYKVMPS